jgi:hypothetical protein
MRCVILVTTTVTVNGNPYWSEYPTRYLEVCLSDSVRPHR